MAFAAMFIATVFIVIVLVGLFLLLVGIILDITWGSMKKKGRKVHAVHKVFAILLTVIGALAGIGPLAVVGVAVAADKFNEWAEISDLGDEDRVYIGSFDKIYSDGFDYRGEHYIKVEEMHPQSVHDRFIKDKIGAIIADNGEHRLIYDVHNTVGATILFVEYSSGIFVQESEAGRIIEYYDKEAPYYCEVSTSYSEPSVTVEDIDSERVREIRDLIYTTGGPDHYQDEENSDLEGYLLFYTTDDLACDDISFKQTSDGLIASFKGEYLILEGEDEEFIRDIISRAQ